MHMINVERGVLVNYSKWAKQYEDEAEKVKKHIKEVRQELKTAKTKKQSTEIYYRLTTLYQIYYELKETATKINNYAGDKCDE